MHELHEKTKKVANWWSLSIHEICKKLESESSQGLSVNQVEQRLSLFGPNVLPEQKKNSPVLIFFNQFSSFIVWVLIIALVISALLGEWGDACSIGVIIIANGIIGFIQEYKAEQSLSALRKLMKPSTRVIRNNMLQTIPASQLVPGDLVVLEAGDQVAADGRVCLSMQLATQEAQLTGESTPVAKITDALVTENSDQEVSVGDRKNMVFMGTSVVRGKGHMIVTQTGLATELGSVAKMLQAQEHEITPLQIQLAQLGHRIVGLFLGIVGIIFLLGVMRGTKIIDMLLTSLSLAVAAIPEGLPAITTIALALGVQRMVKRNTLVRRLASVETLGRVSVICSDKTGTLTQNEMTVRALWVNETIIDVSGVGYAPEGVFTLNAKPIDPVVIPELMQALNIAVLCNGANLIQIKNRWEISGDPTEGALLTVAGKAGLFKNILEQENQLRFEIPFDSERKCMSVLRETKSGGVMFVKGAPDVLLACSHEIIMNGNKKLLTPEIKQQVMHANKQLACKGLRVLAVAYRDIHIDTQLQVSHEENLIFVGLIAMMDPPRPEVKAALKTCKTAGIRTVMLTGDHKETALAIAGELGLLEKDSIAVSGAELEQMSDAQLKKNISQIAVYARITVEHKMRIVRAFQELGEIVAMTGDGVNDAPAIKTADIGIAMGITGTEVTKQASDMVITDDNFASIVSAIQEGRGIYDNISKFVNFLLSSNIAELLVIFLGTCCAFKDPAGIPFIPLLPIQLLWLNLVTDGLPALALGVDPLDPAAMQRPPRKPSEPILSLANMIHLFVVGIIIALGTLAACFVGLKTSAAVGHTMAFTLLVVLELVRVQLVRSAYRMSFFSNRWLIFALGSSLGLQLMVVYTPVLQKIFGTVGLGFFEWGVMLTITCIVALASFITGIIFS
jgi:Ca2+-transporting ATPase